MADARSSAGATRQQHDSDDNPLDALRREAALAFGFPEATADRLRGGNRQQL